MTGSQRGPWTAGRPGRRIRSELVRGGWLPRLTPGTLPVVTQNSSDIERLGAEQQPNLDAPCPRCGSPVGDSRIFTEGNEPRLLVHCGGSSFDRSGKGCFTQLAWNPADRKWDLY
jgi:hypothetical protein